MSVYSETIRAMRDLHRAEQRLTTAEKMYKHEIEMGVMFSASQWKAAVFMYGASKKGFASVEPPAAVDFDTPRIREALKELNDARWALDILGVENIS